METLEPTLAAKQVIPAVPMSLDYIRGLTEGEGTFTFCGVPSLWENGNEIKRKLPTFAITLADRDEELLKKVRDILGLRNKIYKYGVRKGRRVLARLGTVTLRVRDFGQLKNIIVPLFYNKLYGNKGIQFHNWIMKIGSDPEVPESYKLITRLYMNGHYNRNPNIGHVLRGSEFREYIEKLADVLVARSKNSS